MNNINLLLKIIQRLKDNNIEVWLFGGWAEELLQIIKPRKHKDIDFIYPEKNFDKLDRFISNNNDLQEIIGKRFLHKRAFLFENVMVEFFLLNKDDDQYMTIFFGKHKFVWPKNILQKSIDYNGIKTNIASKEALNEYRKKHKVIEEMIC